MNILHFCRISNFVLGTEIQLSLSTQLGARAYRRIQAYKPATATIVFRINLSSHLLYRMWIKIGQEKGLSKRISLLTNSKALYFEQIGFVFQWLLFIIMFVALFRWAVWPCLPLFPLSRRLGTFHAVHLRVREGDLQKDIHPRRVGRQ